MSIKRRILALPVTVAVIFGLGFVGVATFTTDALSSIKKTASRDYPLLEQTKELALDVHKISAQFKDAVAEGDREALDRIAETAGRARGRLEKISAIPGLRERAEQQKAEFDEYYANASVSARMMLGMDEGDPQPFVEKMQAALQRLEENLRATNAQTQAQFNAGVENSIASINNAVTFSIALAVIVFLCMAAISHFVIRAIWKQLGGEPEYARGITQAVAAGDLTMDVRTEPGDTGSLLTALKEMQQRLEGLVSNIKRSVDTLRVRSAEVASGGTRFSERTISQAGALAQTAASLETLTSTVINNSESALQANQLVVATLESARKGSDAMEEVVAKMSVIRSRSGKISDIIGVIDGLAFQTNLLALNAAVEAARAGEQGRGFSVVAAEVRNLASRSAGAAREIAALICDSVSQIESGADLVDHAGTTMSAIAASAKQAADIMNEIASASQEQRGGIEGINESVGRMDEMTREDRVMVDEVSTAARSMEEEAIKLSELVNTFKLASS